MSISFFLLIYFSSLFFILFYSLWSATWDSPSYQRCVSYGVLEEAHAEKLYKKILKRKKGSSGGTTSGNSGAAPPAKKKKKAKIIKEEMDPDMQVSGTERVGSAVI